MADIFGTPGPDVLDGTEDPDFIFGSSGDDIINGNGGDDQISAGLDNDTVDGGEGNDLLIGAAGDDSLSGGNGDDIIRTGSGVDTIDGGDGFDRFSCFDLTATQGAYVDLSLQLVFNDGFGNAETLTSIEAVGSHTRFADTFIGDEGHNLLWGGLGDTLIANGGDDEFFIDDAPNYVDGGDGIDSIIGLTATHIVDIDFDGFYEQETTTEGYQVDLLNNLIFDPWGGVGNIYNVENVTASVNDDFVFGDDLGNVLNGDEGDDSIRGNGGDDTLLGGGGDDLLRGGAGVDSFDGGDGFDRVSFFHADATQGVVASLLTQTISNDGYGNAETMTSIEGLGGHTRFADDFTGDDNDNLFLIGGGDTLHALGGNDDIQVDNAPALIDGGDGIDTITLFTQSKLVDNNGDGIAEFVTTTNGVKVNLNTGKIINDGFGGKGLIVGIENVGGSSGDDTLTGDANENVLQGYEGGDILRGGGGDDELIGFDGDDDLNGGGGVDVLDAGAGNDFIGGDGGADTIFDGAGDDVVTGDAGKDVLFWSGLGQDIFTDFEDGREKVHINDVAGVDDFSDLTLSITADGWVKVSYGDGANSLILAGITAGHVSASDFIFGGG
jgi:Ca2+-binding RTX toxin-like protein